MNGFVVSVPFREMNRIVKGIESGATVESLMVMYECSREVIDLIVAHQKRLALRKKYKVDEEPA
jgi:hypothetical protein